LSGLLLGFLDVSRRPARIFEPASDHSAVTAQTLKKTDEAEEDVEQFVERARGAAA
jgi:hypothetical protein